MIFNLNEFFYNVIPGIIFLIFWSFENEKIKTFIIVVKNFLGNDVVFGIALLLVALTIGIVMHGMYRTIRSFYQKYCKRCDEELDKERDDNVLVHIEGKRELPEFFSSRASIWASGAVGTVISLTIVPKFWIYYILIFVVLMTMYYTDNKKEKSSVKRMARLLNKRWDAELRSKDK
jgi:chromate transport protein ChrA